jgi:AraC-like DNA-binding protein
MISFDTDGLRPRDRFDHWCEVRAKGLFGVTIEVPRERRRDFHGRFAARDFGGATIAEMQASSYHVSRSSADINRLPGDSLYVAHQVRGPGALHSGNERVHMIGDGAMSVSYSDMPYSGIPLGADGFHFRAIKIPVAGNELLAAGRNLVSEPLAQHGRVTPLIRACFTAITAARIEAADAEAAIGHIAQLALLARGRVTSGAPETSGALRHGYLQMALALIGRHLTRPDLSPAQVARALNTSVRRLHLLFEPTGLSFSRTVLAMRLAEARQQIEAVPHLSVTEIAHACGFDSLATFYRTFRQTYGMAPGDLRQALPRG